MEKDKTENTFTVEFVVKREKALNVRTAVQKIKSLFNTDVELGKVAPKAYQEDCVRQWIIVSSSKEEDVKGAKEYIIALTSPEVSVTLDQSESVAKLSKDDLQDVEYHSHAVLKWNRDKKKYEISGAELAVVLAQSMVDAMLSTPKTDDVFIIDDEVEKRGDEDTTRKNLDQNNSSLPPALLPLVSSLNNPFVSAHPKELHYPHPDNVFDQQSSHLSQGQPLQYPHSGVAQFSSCLETSKSQLPRPTNHHQLRPGSQPHSQFPMDTDRPAISHTPKFPSTTAPTSARIPSGPSTSTAGLTSHGHIKSPFGNSNPTLSPMEVGGQEDNKSTEKTVFSRQALCQQEYLRNVGLSCNYNSEDVDTALSMFNMEDVIVPSQFLEILSEIKSARHGGGAVQLHAVSSSSTASDVGSMGLRGRGVEPQNSSAVGADPQDFVVISDDDSGNDDFTVSGKEVPKRQAAPSGIHPAPTQPEKTPSRNKSKEHRPRTDLEQPVGKLPSGSGDCVGVGETSKLRYIVIDGSNVAMCHGDNKVFSSRGLEICINYFRDRGHPKVLAFVSESYRYSKNPIFLKDRQTLERLNEEGFVKFTPARRVNGKQISAYEDRFILNLALKEDAVVVSNDQFRDLCMENPKYLHIAEKRLLQFVFADDHFMPPDDPLGRNGPSLDQFLSKELISAKPSSNRPFNSQQKAWGKGQVAQGSRTTQGAGFKPKPVHHHPTMSGDREPVDGTGTKPLARSQQQTEYLFGLLTQIFPDQDQQQCVRVVLRNHREETDINKLTNFCINALCL